MTTVPQEPGGWWHDFVCPTHGTELAGRDGEAFFGACGCTLTGQKFHGAWLALEHQEIARAARHHARRFTTHGDHGDRAAAVEILRTYGALYSRIEAEGWSESSEPWMLRGKLFAQALSEAQWAVGIADAVAELASVPEVGQSTSIRAMLAGVMRTMVDARHTLVVERGDHRNNYTAWLDAAIRLVALAQHALGEPEPERHTLTALYEHVNAAVMDDGWEWEASTYYHLFVLRAYLLTLRGTDPADLPADVERRLRGMVDVFAVLAGPDGRLPVLHDGPYDRLPMQREVLEVVTLANQFWDSTGLEPVERFARTAIGDRDDGLEAMLDGWFAGQPRGGAAAARGFHHFADAGYVVLSDQAAGLHAVLDAGPHGGAHGHFDKLSLYLYGDGAAWQPAPGVPPYGSPLRHGYYASSQAHPTVRIDGQEQQEGTGRVTTWRPQDGLVVAETADAIAGAIVRRALLLADGVLIDVLRVECADGDDHDIALGLRPACDLAIGCVDGGWTTHWTTAEGTLLSGSHRASAGATLQARPVRGPSDNPARTLMGADWLVRGASAFFVTAWTVGRPSVTVTDATQVDGAVLITLATPDTFPTTHEVPL
ncbi:heparinase II/III domain-containing protein [Demequina flava]|uniref:heparinase II/III domain-containing protein n=1 Tax=Demequina flava TaxID=1095025 RepID=UPI000784ED68|nr:heparinase II/III family protein [Demequina flava]